MTLYHFNEDQDEVVKLYTRRELVKRVAISMLIAAALTAIGLGALFAWLIHCW